MSEFDSFDDVLHSDHNTGIFAGTEAALDNGFKKHLEVTTTPIADGLALEFGCEGCKKKVRLTLDWAEVIALKNGLSPKLVYAPNVPLFVQTAQGPRPHGSASKLCQNPSNWSFHQKEHAWGPDLRCQCNWLYAVRMQPREIDASLRSGQRFLGQPEAEANYHCQAYLHAAKQRR